MRGAARKRKDEVYGSMVQSGLSTLELGGIVDRIEKERDAGRKLITDLNGMLVRIYDSKDLREAVRSHKRQVEFAHNKYEAYDEDYLSLVLDPEIWMGARVKTNDSRTETQQVFKMKDILYYTQYSGNGKRSAFKLAGEMLGESYGRVLQYKNMSGITMSLQMALKDCGIAYRL
ncbi:MAG: hypothetical protein HY518_03825 [Candidatus Aenigmarchaeota archaeon]|nr:hypothetical protein [Candidatus Aenigmarchaeota archaeon]